MPTPLSDYRTIPLTRGQFATVDTADYDWLNQWKWQAHWAPSNRQFYAVRDEWMGNGKTRTIRMHRQIAGLVHGDKLDCDHRNMNTLDNRRENLRVATRSQNQANRGAQRNSTSGMKGVYWRELHKKWNASIRVNGRLLFLGNFQTKEEARDAYSSAAKLYFGEFARTC